MDEERLVAGDMEDSQDDKGSNNSGSTVSHSSEEFVKVNQDDATLDETGGEVPRDDVEELPPISSAPAGGNLLDKIDPRAIPTENMASDSYLKDYYDQLPSETAEFTAHESGDLLGSDPVEQGGGADVLQPEFLSSQDPFEPAPAIGTESNLAAELCQGGHPSFEPAPASSFETDHVETIPEEPELVPIETEAVGNEPSVGEDSEKDFDETNQTEFGLVASKMDQQEDHVQDEPELEEQEVVEPEPIPEPEPEVLKEEVLEEVDPPSPDSEDEVKDIPAPPVVEDIKTEPEKPAQISSQIPAAGTSSTEQGEGKVATSKPDEEDPVIDLIYWRDVKKTAAVFSVLLVILTSLICFSVISVFSYAGLALLTVTVAFRLYRLVLQTLNGTQQPHPFQEILDKDITLSEERMHKYANAVLGHLNCTLTCARDLLLVKNTVSSLKFGVFLWLLTYVGALFNGLTLVIVDTVLIFTVPPIYEKYQTQIDHYCHLARDKVGEIMSKVKAKLPGSKKEKTQ